MRQNTVFAKDVNVPIDRAGSRNTMSIQLVPQREQYTSPLEI
jgi:hypothetical protein